MGYEELNQKLFLRFVRLENRMEGVSGKQKSRSRGAMGKETKL